MSKTYAVVDGTPGSVVNMIVWDGVADFDPGAGLTAIDVTQHPVDAAIGYTWSGATFTPPNSPVTAAIELWVNKYRFMQLFTPTQRVRFNAARKLAAANTDYASAQGQLLAGLEDFVGLYDALPDDSTRGGVNLLDPQLAYALEHLFVPMGIIAEGDVARIIANQAPA